jgi:carboxymethylproline synthase
MRSIKDVFELGIENKFLWIQFNRLKEANPFSRLLTQELMRVLAEVELDPEIKGVVLTGGIGRSFSTGGDFNDVARLSKREEVFEYLNEIIDLYQAILRVTKPTLALVDHYAIGQGLQVALLTDWRIASSRTKISMPELKNGVACPLGALILETLFGRAAMLKDVIGCSMLSLESDRMSQFFEQIVDEADLFSAGNKWIERVLEYPEVPFRLTKRIQNKRFIVLLEDIREDAAEAHIQSILARTGQAHFQKILNR